MFHKVTKIINEIEITVETDDESVLKEILKKEDKKKKKEKESN
jgi:hypothetical protein